MEFIKVEVVFYAAIIAAACFATLFRLWRDNNTYTIRVTVGRCFSSGVLAFGIIGSWIGSRGVIVSDSGGPWFFVAVSAIIGTYSSEIHDRIVTGFTWILAYILKRLGIVVNKDEPKA